MRLFIGTLIALAIITVGCGNNRNPVNVGTEVDTVAEVETTGGIQVTNSVSAAGKAAVELENAETGAATLEINVDYRVEGEKVVVTVAAETGGIVYEDFITIFYVDEDGNEAFIGSVEVSEEVYWTKVDLTFDPHPRIAEGSGIIVRIARDGVVIAENDPSDDQTETASITVSGSRDDDQPATTEDDQTEAEDDQEETVEDHSPGAEVEDIELNDVDEFTIFFTEDVEIGNRRSTLRNLAIFNEDDDEIVIDDVEEDDGSLIIFTEDELAPGEYTVEYNGRSGLEVDGEDLDEFSAGFEVEGPAVEVEDVDVESTFYITITLTERVEIGRSRSALRNITVTRNGEEIVIDLIEEDRGRIILTAETTLLPGEYTVEYNGRSGLEVDGEDLPPFSFDFDIEGEEVVDEETETTDETAVVDGDLWVSITTGVLTEDGSVVTATLDAEGIGITDWARGAINGPSWTVGAAVETNLYIVTEQDLGLSGNYTIGDVRIAAWEAGYRLVPMEVAVLARFFYKDQPADEHLLFVSEYLQFQGKDHMLVVTGQAYGKPAGDWLAAHRFSQGNASAVFPGHKFVVTK